MAEHRLWLHPQSHMPASYYAAPQGRRCHLFVKKMRQQVRPYVRKARSPPDDSDQKARAQNVGATLSPGSLRSGHRDHSVMDDVIYSVRFNP
jgi:hypothetical protein